MLPGLYQLLTESTMGIQQERPLMSGGLQQPKLGMTKPKEWGFDHDDQSQLSQLLGEPAKVASSKIKL